MEIYLLYTCNAHHEHTSKDLIALRSTRYSAISFAINHAKVQDTEEYLEQKISEDDLYLLRTIAQTQNRNQNYIIEKHNCHE